MSLQAADSAVCFQGDRRTTTLGKASSDLFPCILHYVIILHTLVSQSFILIYLCLYHSHGSNDKENAIILLCPIPSPQSPSQITCLGPLSNTFTHQRPWELQSLPGIFWLCTGHSAGTLPAWTTQQILKEAPGCTSEQHFHVWNEHIPCALLCRPCYSSHTAWCASASVHNCSDIKSKQNTKLCL